MNIAALKTDDRDQAHTNQVGVDIRALRKARNLTLAEMALKLGRSVGFLSQIERGISDPSISDVRNIAELLDVPLSFFFANSADNKNPLKHVVRGDERRKLGNVEQGLVEELLSPDLSGSFEIIRSEFAPGAILDKAQTRQTEEAGYVISGKLDLEISGIWHSLNAGDSFRFENEPYRWRNKSDEPAVVIWVISPPVY